MRRRITFSHVRSAGIVAVVSFFALFAASSVRAEDAVAEKETEARKAQREENMRAMLHRAQSTTVTLADKNRSTDAVLIPKPLFHYTDEPRRITDATLWGWTRGGRLVSICKIEKYDRPPEQMWLYCFGSLSTGLMDVKWADGRPWSSTKPGLEFQPIAGAPEPGQDAATRLRQMKELANHFEARIVTDPPSHDSQQMRLLSRPILRYDKSDAPVLDGAAFGLTTNGTNPDAILVIELHSSNSTAPQWKFGMAGMTSGALTVKLDDKVVWTKPSVPSAGRFDTWLFFYGKPDLESGAPQGNQK